jgi:D-alanine--poly(phosphoribitol) ligase subunit 1
MSRSLNLAAPLNHNSRERPRAVAVKSGDREMTYAQAAATARDIGAILESASIGIGSRVGILASRSLEACVGVLGAAWAGAAYVPIPTRAPQERLLSILSLAEVGALFVDGKGSQLLSEALVEALPEIVFVSDETTAARLRNRRRVYVVDRLPEAANEAKPIEVSAENLAYIEFTSGTTGVPKGVMISAGAVGHYVSMMQDRYGLTPDDRVAETAELSFDISVSNMFTAWNAGASLHILSARDMADPVRFVRDHSITFWFSVPSIVALIKRVDALRPGAMLSLRRSLFCGEPLPVQSALTWQAAAPNSTVDNLYGPTEATVFCLAEPLTDPPVVTPHRDILAIGVPLPGTEAAIFDQSRNVLPVGQQGELALSGPQLAEGYFREPTLSVSRFPVIDGKRWYLTGDLAVKDESARFHHLGRIDNQIKVLGLRVELEEVEAHLRIVCGTEAVAAVPWKMSHGSAEGIIAFIEGAAISPSKARQELAARLPAYMVPTTIRCVNTLPMSVNGKLDRRALLAQLDQGLL